MRCIVPNFLEKKMATFPEGFTSPERYWQWHYLLQTQVPCLYQSRNPATARAFHCITAAKYYSQVFIRRRQCILSLYPDCKEAPSTDGRRLHILKPVLFKTTHKNYCIRIAGSFNSSCEQWIGNEFAFRLSVIQDRRCNHARKQLLPLHTYS